MNKELNINPEELQALIDDPVDVLIGKMQALLNLFDKVSLLYEEQSLLRDEADNLKDKELHILNEFIDDLHDKYGTSSLLELREKLGI